MIDEHIIPNPEWGVRPILFYLGDFPIPSYSFFVALAMILGILVYWLEAKKQKSMGENTFYIFIGALIGGLLGAKIVTLIAYWQLLSFTSVWNVLLTGKSIVGGLIGGTVGVLITKRYLGIKEKKGNLFAPAIALSVAVGRIGCFLRGCCYGSETILPWGVNFGDGIYRHPTELYESIFMFGMFFFLLWKKKQNPAPGQLFKILMIAYFTFRFFIEFIRVEPIFLFGLTFFQVLSFLVIVYFIVKK